MEKRLIVELNGGRHLDNQKYDMESTVWLKECGFKVLHFWNNDILQQTASLIEIIMQALGET
ncbi:TPA: DUF559 domain-containing protein [Legionella pneumophila]|uniref:DUF559 domain-containing protein n=1 Tax=Legionella pneumophila TaxID=446 RepID=UPI0004B373EC|nr:DUF559 domain-containing protein [Legionella pneumophila]MCW8428116.1 DUF559 domain-containing protein [Legionella pneumophila]